MPQIQDLEAEDEDEQQAAKRARQQGPVSVAAAASAAGAGAGAANGLSLAELPEVAAAMHNPGQLQVVLQKLLGSHRLCLVLDLDHTLVNSAKFSEVDADWEYRLEQLAAEQLSRPKESRDLHRLARVAMWTKLRPGVREFLRRAAERFELWIYTAGSTAYADAMVELLDPTGHYFGSRVIAQGVPSGPDDSPADAVVFKRLMQGLEGREPVVLIVDDSSAVWPNDRRNLFVVERYIYFPSSRRRFGMQGKSLLEIERDECPSRGMLMTALRVFEQLHGLVFARMRAAPPAATPDAAAGWDIRNVMAAEKRQVLSGVHLVFSRVIPLESNPRQHPLWQLAEQFGATCGEQCNETTTHVVATHGGTEKVMWAKQNNKHVVSPAWLECSCILWQRANEDKFPTPL
ncbi:HAD-like domain-containing protein [Scenedesmus sp. NREL 46B-D3]|nr:HAD-like domain-containing protein [Scenedesmus sp. NREL 46B-D3]